MYDPYGGVRGADAVGRHFGHRFAPHQVTFAAGVTSLLHDLGGLADGGPIAAPALVHPDLETWAVADGAELHVIDGPLDHARLAEAVRDLRPALLHLDRPTFTAEVLALDELEDLARIAAAAGTVILIDEAPAPYLGPEGSAAGLVGRADNLVVLRGFTKAYSWGGLRGGFALASEGVAGRVRELVTPLQMGELAFEAALRLLAAGDVFGKLRARIHQVKPAFADRVAADGLDVIRGHPDIPWIVVRDEDGAATRFFHERGIRGLRPVAGPVASPRQAGLLHLTVPLSDERIALFEKLASHREEDRADDDGR
ncbi:aminotransferase class I/II-fold pyridoxal phosphate-dependent enzyme [Actinomadura yumaensis]|uniref:aminotransferase class I/II-fold pyridoxal phosphate-dependent enzyme n=1 Tax=Actinomadura yumaensis TaxID=111807 RepID=UPI0036145A83